MNENDIIENGTAAINPFMSSRLRSGGNVMNNTLDYQSRPRVIKLFSCSTQLSMNFFLLINVKMPTIVGISTVMSGKTSILGLSEPNISQISSYFYTYEHLKFHAQLS